jgi:cobalt-zinc-cadmium efflux system outer membrane protein
MRCLLSVLVLVGAPLALSAQESPSSEVSLPALVREALERNPEIQMARRLVKAKRARVPQAGALPDPMLMYGVVNEASPVPFESLGQRDFSEVYVGISQDIPFPGKRGLREKVAREEASAAEWAYEAVRRRIMSEVAQGYFDLYAVHAAFAIVERNFQLMDQLVKVARARYSVGQATQQDVLDAELELSRLEERRSLLVQRRGVVEAVLARVLYRTNPVPFGRPGSVVKTALEASLEQVLTRAQEESPLLREQERFVAQGERKVDLARRERLPDLGFSFVYHNRDDHFFNPYYSYGGTLTLPIYAGRKQRKAIEEAAENLGGASSALEAARAQVRYEVTDAFLMASTADRLLRLYDEGILKQARLSLDSAIAQYQVGKVDFLTLVTSLRRLLDYDLTYHEQLAEHEKALARLSAHVSAVAGQAF